jgi:hypothetical protein
MHLQESLDKHKSYYNSAFGVIDSRKTEMAKHHPEVPKIKIPKELRNINSA